MYAKFLSNRQTYTNTDLLYKHMAANVGEYAILANICALQRFWQISVRKFSARYVRERHNNQRESNMTSHGDNLAWQDSRQNKRQLSENTAIHLHRRDIWMVLLSENRATFKPQKITPATSNNRAWQFDYWQITNNKLTINWARIERDICTAVPFGCPNYQQNNLPSYESYKSSAECRTKKTIVL